ncbi:hypothetical protein QYZ87_03370 [Porphyromonadaceae bacterium W3.11]|nr:hypothetical protein [Porphyromonadaceae bacterium W3.11]
MTKLIILYSWIAGITVFIGGIIAYFFNKKFPEKSTTKTEITHTMMSFGAGIILSAVALVLVPEGMEKLSLVPMIVTFLSGAVVFMFLDQYLSKKGGKLATLLAMMLDFIPEAIALGAVFATDMRMATLLALFIGVQNLPESFNAYRDLVAGDFSPKKTLMSFFILSFFGVFSALIGYFLLSDSPNLTAHLMIFSSGGILYLLIQDIIPESQMKKNHFISLGATLGFLVGLIGDKVI